MKSILVAACASLLALACVAQERPKKVDNSPEAFLRYQPGATWRYRFQQKPDGKPVDQVLRCVREVSAGERKAWELRSTQGRWAGWAYRAATPEGIFTFRNRYLGPLRGVAKGAPTRLVPGPIGAVTRWKWTEQGSVQTDGSSAGPDPDALRKHFEGRIVSMDEAVTVPAGAFRAVRVEIRMTSEYFGSSVRTLWLVRGKGIVKDVVTNPKTKRSNVVELTGFTPGEASRVSAVAQIDDILGDRKFRKLAVYSVEPVAREALEPLVSSRFWLVRSGRSASERILFRHDGKKTVIFDAALGRSWRQLLRVECPEFTRDRAIAFTRAYGILLAAHAGATELASRGAEVGVRTNDDFDVTAHIRGKGADGARLARRWSRMWFRDGKLVKQTSNLVELPEKSEPRRR